MTDEEMAKYIPSYGSRLAIRSFCRIKEKDYSSPQGLDRLHQKIAEGRGGKRKRSVAEFSSVQNEDVMARRMNKNALKRKRRIEVGWLHYQHHDFHQVRCKNGGGTRHLVLEKSTTVKDIMEMAKNLFFPEGKSPKGCLKDFTYDICDFKKQTVPMTTTITELYEQSKLKMVRLYLRTQPTLQSLSDTESHEEV